MEYNIKLYNALKKLREQINENVKYSIIQDYIYKYSHLLNLSINQLLLMAFNKDYLTDIVYNDVVDIDNKIKDLQSQLELLEEKRKLATSCICASHGHSCLQYNDEYYFCPVCGEYIEKNSIGYDEAVSNAQSLTKTFYSSKKNDGK